MGKIIFATLTLISLNAFACHKCFEHRLKWEIETNERFLHYCQNGDSCPEKLLFALEQKRDLLIRIEHDYYECKHKCH